MLKGKLTKVLKFLLFLFLGVAIFWYVYHKQDPKKIWSAFEEVNFFWLGATVLVMLVSHVSRSLRWMMLIKPLGKNVSFWNATLTTFLGYFANMALPRLGEITRCAVLGKYEKIPTSKLLGTVVVERAIDVIMFLLCLLLAVSLQFAVFSNLQDRYLASVESSEESSFLWLYLSLGIFTLLSIIFYKFQESIQETKAYVTLKGLLLNIGEGFRTVWKLKKFNLFIFHTLLIWFCYFLMIYFGFQVFAFTQNLSAVVFL